MKPQMITKFLLAVGVATTLGACASLGAAPANADQFAQIRPGLTQDEVRSLVGAPQLAQVSNRSRELLWSYPYTDAWGYEAEFGVDFDLATGLVTETSSQRVND